jgi:hypothetical protein
MNHFLGVDYPPLKKGGQVGSVVGMNMKIPSGSPLYLLCGAHASKPAINRRASAVDTDFRLVNR